MRQRRTASVDGRDEQALDLGREVLRLIEPLDFRPDLAPKVSRAATDREREGTYIGRLVCANFLDTSHPEVIVRQVLVARSGSRWKYEHPTRQRQCMAVAGTRGRRTHRPLRTGGSLPSAELDGMSACNICMYAYSAYFGIVCSAPCHPIPPPWDGRRRSR